MIDEFINYILILIFTICIAMLAMFIGILVMSPIG